MLNVLAKRSKIKKGQRFGMLEVIGVPFSIRTAPIGKKCAVAVCRCDCGKITCPATVALHKRHTQSCGCLIGRSASIRELTHGHSVGGKKSPEYRAWVAMRARCLNPLNEFYRRYGGRGITISQRWESFENFLEDMGLRPTSDHSLDRINNDGPYSKENCRWATFIEQQRNKSDSILISAFGETKSIMEWPDDPRCRVSHSVLRNRVRLKWSPEDTITVPLCISRRRPT